MFVQFREICFAMSIFEMVADNFLSSPLYNCWQKRAPRRQIFRLLYAISLLLKLCFTERRFMIALYIPPFHTDLFIADLVRRSSTLIPIAFRIISFQFLNTSVIIITSFVDKHVPTSFCTCTFEFFHR